MTAPSAPQDPLVAELAKVESDLERIEGQRIAVEARIAALRKELAAHEAPPQPRAPEPLPGFAPRTPADKVKLFRQLFRGRPDLYPTRFVSKKTGMPGYAPACSNKFVPGICELPKVKCGDCTRQAFKPVDDAAVIAHLKGQH
ncbi:MAG: restriction endonuclease subunit R, partial [Casimicrobiaceae bacterium]